MNLKTFKIDKYFIFTSVTFILFLAAIHRSLAYYWRSWSDPNGYYVHAPLVPFIIGYMIYLNRKDLELKNIKNSTAGIVMFMVGALIYILGMTAEWDFVSSFSIIIMLLSLSLFFLGYNNTKKLIFPLLFVITIIPLPDNVLDFVTGKYQLISSTVAGKMLALLGYTINQEGNTLDSPDLPTPLLIGGVCSGLKLLIVLITASLFFAYTTFGAKWKKVLLVALSFPFSIFVNSLRVAMIGLVGIWTGSADAIVSFHDYSGYIGLILSVFILMFTCKILKLDNNPPDNTEKPISENALSKKAFPWVGNSIITVFLVAIFVLSFAIPSLYDLPKGTLDRSSIPTTFGKWHSQEMEIEESVRKILNKGDLLNLYYSTGHENDLNIQLFLTAALDIGAFHDPHVCLPGGGQRIVKEYYIQIPLKDNSIKPVNATVFITNDEYDSEGIVIFWYSLGPISYPNSAIDLNKIVLSNRWSDLLRIIQSPSSVSQVKKDILSRQITWYRFSTNVTTDVKTDENRLIDFIKEYLANSKNFGK